MAPKGWMNDPCALGFDPVSSRYITAFQWNPNGNDWGDIAWGHASSPDLMSWTVSERPSLYPEASYDRCGVFTGCLLRGNANGEADGTLICFYTSVSKLPISYLLPYNVGCESLSAATSINGGVTWERCTKNPIIPHSPEGVKVTGWRDPYVAPWPAADKALDRKAGRYLYGCISGGISGETPTTFLYSIQSSDLQQWEYLGPLIKVGLNNSYSNWSGDLGLNWEVTTFCTLSDHTGSARSFIVAGAEGGLERVHAQLWISGSLQAEVDPASKISMTHDFGGVFDHGCLYASNAFWDPVAKEQVVISWIPEDDLPDALRHRQNWSGMLSLPRVLRLLCYERVAGTLATPLKDISCFEMQPDSHGTWTARTLGFLPDPRVELLRRGATHSQIEDLQLTSSKASEEATLPLRTLQWEIDAEIALEPTCKSVSLTIGHSTGKPSLPTPP
ncbi:MAG: hypothetical protein M1814_003449 [Vezdaea aestivalis]|nr:MAG: hypothetical protein M1814_003449 [Vezdaea aestivalis]